MICLFNGLSTPYGLFNAKIDSFVNDCNHNYISNVPLHFLNLTFFIYLQSFVYTQLCGKNCNNYGMKLTNQTNNYVISSIPILSSSIIMSRRQRGYPWPSLAISPYHSSPPAGLQSYILCPHIVAVCKFVLVVLLLHIHM